MALCSSLQAKGLAVVTESGVDVGSVLGFVLDTERGCIVQVEVRPAGFVRGLVAHELLIEWSSVISWNEKQLVIQDAAVPEKEATVVPSIAPSV